PHEVTASKYVEAMGGPEAVLKRGEAAFGSGNYRWAAELFNHIVFTDPTNEPARQWLASAYEQLGFQAESGAWRSYYLAAALELREGVPDVGDPQLGNQDFLKAVPTLDLFDSLAARFKPETFKRDPFVLAFEFTDTEETVAIHVGPSVVVPRAGRPDDPVATVRTERDVFDRVLLGQLDFRVQAVKGTIGIEGDVLAVRAFLRSLDRPDFWFPIATP
ncbi:MAG: alkyl sulfatase dimerization domain-containing protein, partial [Pseudomonadota bacterium]